MARSDCDRSAAPAAEPEIDYAAALDAAHRFLARWRDRHTENDRDDLAQEAVIILWLQRDRLVRCDAASSFVCTVARRLRGRALRRRNWMPMLESDAVELPSRPYRDGVGGSRGDGDQVREPERHASVRVGDVEVDRDWLLSTLRAALPHLPPQQAAALAGFYLGHDTAWIARRCGLPRHLVKLRLHRGRQRLRQVCEARIAVAMHMGEPQVQRIDRSAAVHPRNRPSRAFRLQENP